MVPLFSWNFLPYEKVSRYAKSYGPFKASSLKGNLKNFSFFRQCKTMRLALTLGIFSRRTDLASFGRAHELLTE